eukprot:TRINITY_DN5794_c1_g1_i1.p1 TRINITY_DN5794_c1_g1~~TRINITY_DN5794_c1_g1_i1.p1  ORF type:complete len:643 (-),score=165.61 TRINITY_DN5794_c1_g1_i1:209-2137(-)
MNGWNTQSIPQASKPVKVEYDPFESSDTTEAKSESEQIWTEHKTVDESGVEKVFYYNNLTKESVWVKPEDFDKKKPTQEECPWKEYVTPEGKKYYHNNITSQVQWDMPQEYKDHLSKQNPESKAKPNKTDSPQDDPKESFRKLLKEKGMTVNWTQEQAMLATRDSPLWKTLKMGDKKQVYQTYLRDLQREEREERKRREEKAENDFIKLLLDNKDIKRSTTFREAMALISSDSRYLGIRNEVDRERLFNTYVNLRADKEKQEAQKRRDDMMVTFRNFLKKDETINHETTWRSYKEKVRDEPIFTQMDKLDSLTVFIDHLKDLEDVDFEKLKKERMERKFRSRKARVAYRKLLLEYYNASHISVKTRWHHFKPLIKDDVRYTSMLEDIDGSTPAELFYDLIDDLEDRFYKDRKVVKDIVKEANVNLDMGIRYDQFVELVKAHPSYGQIHETNLNLIFNDLLDKATKSEEKMKKKLLKKLSSELKQMTITKTTTWEDVKTKLPITSEITEADALEVFNEHIKKRALNDDFDSSVSDGEVAEPRRKTRMITSSDDEYEGRSSRREDDDEKKSKHRDGRHDRRGVGDERDDEERDYHRRRSGHKKDSKSRSRSPGTPADDREKYSRKRSLSSSGNDPERKKQKTKY